MKYFSDRAEDFIFDLAEIVDVRISENQMTWFVHGLGTGSENQFDLEGKCVFIPVMQICFENFSVRTVTKLGRRWEVPEGKGIRVSKDKKLYKNDIPEFLNRLSEDDFSGDIFGIKCAGKDGKFIVKAEMTAGDTDIYVMEIICSVFSFHWDDFGEDFPVRKKSAKEKAAALRADIPALVFSVTDGRVRTFYKMAAALAVCYARSPVKFFPKIFTHLYALDENYVFPIILKKIIGNISAEVMEECREKVRNYPRSSAAGRSGKWVYALPAVFLRAVVLVVIGVIVFGCFIG